MRHNVFLTVKEALNNVLKHSGATTITISLNCSDNILHIEIIDNGKGFSQKNKIFSGNGLYNMEKRIKDIGGKYEISSEEDKGTKVSISISIN